MEWFRSRQVLEKLLRDERLIAEREARRIKKKLSESGWFRGHWITKT